jgi:hypothetical protein
MLVEAGEKGGTGGGRKGGATEVPDPDPVEGAEGDFESAGPVHAPLEGILFVPRGKLSSDGVEVIGPGIQAPRLSKENEMVVAVEFPEEFVVTSAGEVEVGDTAEVAGWKFVAVNGIATPLDGGGDIDVCAEEREMAVQNRGGEAGNGVGVGG